MTEYELVKQISEALKAQIDSTLGEPELRHLLLQQEAFVDRIAPRVATAIYAAAAVTADRSNAGATSEAVAEAMQRGLAALRGES